jgi:hypothetical protein
MALDTTSGRGPEWGPFGVDAPVTAEEVAGHARPDQGIIWLGVAGALLGLLTAGGVWVAALVRPWFQPWERPWGALLVMTAVYPIALLAALAGRLNRTMAGIAVAGCAVFAAFIIRLGAIGLLHLPAALLLLAAAAFVLSQPLRLPKLQVIGGALLAVGAVAIMLSGAATIFRVPAEQECVAYWELQSGRTLWRPWSGESALIAQETPEGFRDDVKKMGLICDLNSLSTRKAVLGLAQFGAAGLALLAAPLTALGLAFVLPIALSAVLGGGAALFEPLAAVGVLLILAGAACAYRGLRQPPAQDEDSGTGLPDDVSEAAATSAASPEPDLSQWQRPL